MNQLGLLLSSAVLAMSCANKGTTSSDPRESGDAPTVPGETTAESEVTAPATKPPPPAAIDASMPEPETVATAPTPNTMRLVVATATELRRSERRAVDRLANLLKKKSVVTQEPATPDEVEFLANIDAGSALPQHWGSFESVLYLGPGVVAVYHPPTAEPVYLERAGEGLAISENLVAVANALKPENTSKSEEPANVTK